MNKESCNLIVREVELATSNKKWYSQMLPFFDDYLHAKNAKEILMIKEYCNLKNL